MAQDSPPKFVGTHGEDWCVRAAELGPPDRVSDVMHWLIVPGPPISCYLAVHPPRTSPEQQTMFHMHPSTYSIHVVLDGRGMYHAEGVAEEIGPGSVMYHGPKVRHCIYPLMGHRLAHLSIQCPGGGYRKDEWVVCPEAGVADKFGDLQAFIERFGSADLVKELVLSSSKFVGPRWRAFISGEFK